MAANPSINVFHRSSGTRYTPEQSPFHTIIVDITHRCDMQCKNCYIPNRDIPDMDSQWLYDILARLPQRTRIRLVGAEPTMRRDLADILRQIRRLGHLPVLVTHGLQLARLDYIQTLKQAGLRSVYLSCNGGLDDDLYQALDNARCAKQKLAALENLGHASMNIAVGMILVRGANEDHLPEFYRYLKQLRQVREFRLRSVGAIGQYMHNPPFSLEELIDLMTQALSVKKVKLRQVAECSAYFKDERITIKMTEWPDLGSNGRGRLTPEGMLEPFFEHVLANAGGY